MRVKAGLECVVANPATIHKSIHKREQLKINFRNFRTYYATAQF